MSDDQARAEAAEAEAAQVADQDERTRQQRAADMPDELKVDVDQDKLAAWDEAKGDYGITDSAERPIMTGEGEPDQPRPEPDADSAEGNEQAEAEAADRARQDAKGETDTG